MASLLICLLIYSWRSRPWCLVCIVPNPNMSWSCWKRFLKMLKPPLFLLVSRSLEPVSKRKPVQTHIVTFICCVSGFYYINCCFLTSLRQRWLPGATHHGICEAAGGSGTGVCPWGPCAGQVPLCLAGTLHHKHGLPPDWSLNLNTHVWQGEQAFQMLTKKLSFSLCI